MALKNNVLREAIKEVIFLVAWPIRVGGGGWGRATKKKITFFKLIFEIKNLIARKKPNTRILDLSIYDTLISA